MIIIVINKYIIHLLLYLNNNINIYNKKTNNINTLGIFIIILNLVNIELKLLVKVIKILNIGLRKENINDINETGQTIRLTKGTNSIFINTELKLTS